MSVRRAGDRWYVDVQARDPEGKVVRVREPSPVDNKRGAEAHEKKVLALIQTGRWVKRAKMGRPRKSVSPVTVGDPSGPVVTLSGTPSLEAFIPEWLRHQDAKNSASERQHKRQILRDHLLPVFGHLQLDQITVRLVDAYKAEKLRTLKPATVANHVSVLKRVFAVARDWDVVEKVPRIKQVKIESQPFDYLSVEECERFLEHAADWRVFMLAAVRTGLRLGELRGLRWGEVDLGLRKVHVVRAYTQTGWTSPKSGKQRTVDLARDLTEALRVHRPESAARDDLVFPGPGGEPLDESAIYKACKRVCGAAQLGRVLGPHKLRHTFASHKAMHGTPMPIIQAWMGHASITTTMRYSHLAPGIGARYIDPPE